MKPKFEVGEVVILQSECHPEYNGTEATVQNVRRGRWMNADGSNAGEGWSYDLDVLTPNKKSGWAEPALRNKHIPGSLSFRDLMQTLKDPSRCLNA